MPRKVVFSEYFNGGGRKKIVPLEEFFVLVRVATSHCLTLVTVRTQAVIRFQYYGVLLWNYSLITS